MDLHPTQDHLEISDSAAEYLGRELPADRAPKLTADGLSDSEWRGLAEMGWLGMGLPEAVGGLDLSVVEEALVLREFGRHLLPPSTLATMLAGHLALELGDDDTARALASGRRRAAMAVPAVQGGAGPSPASYRLVDVVGADEAIGWSPAGAFLAPLSAFSGAREIRSLDPTLRVVVAENLDLGQARWLSAVASELPLRARVLTAAMLVGGAEASRDLAAEYAKVRKQFGRPIGAFQAIAHACADMAVRCEAALASLYYAGVCVRDGLPERDLYSGVARSVAGEAAYQNAAAAMQVFGGYGQTYEYLPHFYLKRSIIYGLAGGGAEADEAAVLQAESTF